MAKVNLITTENVTPAELRDLKGMLPSSAPTLTLKAVCSDEETESPRLAVFTGAKESYEPGETVEITVAGAIIPGTDTEYGTTKTYPFLKWSDGETNPTRSVTLGDAGDTELVAVFDVVPVATAADLKLAVANTDGNYYLQVADIDLSDEGTWVGDLEVDPNDATIRINVMEFSGVYDGGGHRVTNLLLQKAEYSGLFARVNGSTIVNLTVDCLGFDDASTESSSWGGAALAGYVNKTSDDMTFIANVTTNGTVGDAVHHSRHNTGGMVGRVDSKGSADTGLCMVDCVNNASVYCTRPGTGAQHTGGLVGYIMKNVRMVRCANHGMIVTSRVLSSSQNEGVGGLVGCDNSTSNTSYLVDCTSDGVMALPGGSVNFGSLFGYMQGLDVRGTTVVDGMRKLTGNLGLGSKAFAVRTGVRDYMLAPSVMANTPVVYKAMSANAYVKLGASGDYILVDTSLFEPTVTFSDSAVTGEDVPYMPGVKKYTAAAA